MTGWSPFKTTIGSMFIEMGVKGGVEGKLFDIDIPQARRRRQRRAALTLLEAHTPTSPAVKRTPIVTKADAHALAVPCLAHIHAEHPVPCLFGQLEMLLKGNETESDGINEDKPLMTLASAGVWVLETLAHYAHDPEQWIMFMNDIDGLVRPATPSLPSTLWPPGLPPRLLPSRTESPKAPPRVFASAACMSHACMHRSSSPPSPRATGA